MAHFKFRSSIVIVAGLLAACTGFGPTTQDSGLDADSLVNMNAGIWVDGDGCDHWIIDDGVEGYLTPRFGPDLKPVCREGAVPFSTINFRRTFFGTAGPINTAP